MFNLFVYLISSQTGIILEPLELYKSMDIKHVQLDTMRYFKCLREKLISDVLLLMYFPFFS